MPRAIKTFAQRYGAKFPKAVKKVTDDQEELLAFYEFPAEHWIHLRTTNPIESTFSTVRLQVCGVSHGITERFFTELRQGLSADWCGALSVRFSTSVRLTGTRRTRPRHAAGS
jgi:transposase-like protein